MYHHNRKWTWRLPSFYPVDWNQISVNWFWLIKKSHNLWTCQSEVQKQSHSAQAKSNINYEIQRVCMLACLLSPLSVSLSLFPSLSLLSLLPPFPPFLPFSLSWLSCPLGNAGETKFSTEFCKFVLLACSSCIVPFWSLICLSIPELVPSTSYLSSTSVRWGWPQTGTAISKRSLLWTHLPSWHYSLLFITIGHCPLFGHWNEMVGISPSFLPCPTRAHLPVPPQPRFWDVDRALLHAVETDAPSRVLLPLTISFCETPPGLSSASCCVPWHAGGADFHACSWFTRTNKRHRLPSVSFLWRQLSCQHTFPIYSPVGNRLI